ncbi:MAG: histidine kinase dimerization/phospho-acceptor domain-containing protein, partial [Chloroflexota bacterium]
MELTEQSIIVLAQLILLTLGASYLVRQRFNHINGWLLVGILASTLSFSIILFYNLSFPAAHEENVIPITALIPIAFGTAVFIQFAYRFPILTNKLKIERFVATSAAVFFAVLVTGFALLGIRAAWLIWILTIAIWFTYLWGINVSWRTYISHLVLTHQHLPQSILEPQTQTTKAFHALLSIELIPVIIMITWLGHQVGIFPAVMFNAIWAIGGLSFIYFLIVTFVVYAWQKTTFVAQLLGSSLITQLIIFSIGAVIYAQIVINNDPANAMMHTFMRPFAWLLVCSVVLTLGGLPLFIGLNVIRPIHSMVQAVDEVNRGNLDVSLPIQRNDEIGHWSDAFNSMVTSIRSKNAELSEYSTNLESRVRQRTSMLAEMTERAEKAKQDAIEANQTKSAFIANITHEIRTPLNAIVGFSDILREDVQEAGRAEWAQDLLKIRNSANDLLDMINEILDISKIEAGRTSFFFEEFSLNNMTTEIIDFLRPLAEENRNRLSHSINVEDPVLHGDYMKVRQILQNLV